MTLADTAALFATLAALAAVPSASVALVVARAATSGFTRGLASALGVAAGDLVLVAAAMFGLRALAEALGPAFVLVRALAAALLIVLGASLLARPSSGGEPVDASAGSGFLAGFALTLADAKALVFYFGLLPAYVDPAARSERDVLVVAAVTLVAVGGVKSAYAAAAARFAADVGSRARRGARIACGLVMLAAAGVLCAGLATGATWLP